MILCKKIEKTNFKVSKFNKIIRDSRQNQQTKSIMNGVARIAALFTVVNLTIGEHILLENTRVHRHFKEFKQHNV